MTLLSDMGSKMIGLVTGQSPADLQAQVDAAQQQVTLAVETIIGLQIVMALELFLILVIEIKRNK
jgi:hypothetical protein